MGDRVRRFAEAMNDLRSANLVSIEGKLVRVLWKITSCRQAQVILTTPTTIHHFGVVFSKKYIFYPKIKIVIFLFNSIIKQGKNRRIKC